MPKNRRANATLFGFDFQRNAAIVLMLENIKELKSVRLEGNEEDIEISLNDGQKILAQAKAIEASSKDFSHVRENLKKALLTLSEGAERVSARQLIFITNSTNPFKEPDSRNVFGGFPSRRKFEDLPQSSKDLVQNYLKQIKRPLDLSKFIVQTFPFETDDETERYKFVMQKVNDFIGALNGNFTYGLGKWLFDVWNENVFINGTKKDSSIQLTKEDIIWPILVHETDISRCDDDEFIEEFDVGVYDEVARLYGNTINSCCERVEFFTRVLYDYAQFPCNKKTNGKCREFINATWENYQENFSVVGIEKETKEALTKIVLYNVIHRRITIDKVKQGVNL